MSAEREHPDNIQTVLKGIYTQLEGLARVQTTGSLKQTAEATAVNFKCVCGGYLQPTSHRDLYFCKECGAKITEIAGGSV